MTGPDRDKMRWSLPRALEQAFGDHQPERPHLGWNYSCPCTPTTTCADCERRIDALETARADEIPPLEDPYAYEKWYGPSDPDWDR